MAEETEAVELDFDLRLRPAEHLLLPGILVRDPGICVTISRDGFSVNYAMYAWTVRELQDGILFRVHDTFRDCMTDDLDTVQVLVTAFQMPTVVMTYDLKTKQFEPTSLHED